jgi:7SK snRNA methylphosphate capping enzyme
LPARYARGSPPPPSKRLYLVGTDIDSSIAFNFHAASVTGVDIDPKLVAQASKLLALRSSRARPPTKECARIVDYFPQSAVLEHGFIDSPGDSTRFFASDWAATTDFSGPFDVILALSVSINPPVRPPTQYAKHNQVIKWIHLEHLDQGLKTFFRKCASSLAPGGNLIIELQTWESYEKAVRPGKAPHFSQNIKLLQYRPETSFDELLAGEGLHLCASSHALPRPIKVYRKIA